MKIQAGCIWRCMQSKFRSEVILDVQFLDKNKDIRTQLTSLHDTHRQQDIFIVAIECSPWQRITCQAFRTPHANF